MSSLLCLLAPTRFRPIQFLGCFLVLLGFCLTGAAHGQTWSGNGMENFWSDSANWVGGVPPVNDGNSSLSFDDSAGQFTSDQDLGTPFSLFSLSIDTNQTFEFDGQTLAFGDGNSSVVQMNGSGAAIFNNFWQVNGQLDIQGSGGELILNNDQAGNGVINIARDFEMNGSFAGTGDITVTESTLTLNGGAASNERAIVLEGGTLRGGGLAESLVIGRASNGVLPTIRGGDADGLQLNTVLADGTTLQFTSGLVFLDSAGFTGNGGTIQVQADAIVGGTITAANESETITVEAGGIVAGDIELTGGNLNGSGSIENFAMLNAGVVSGELTFGQTCGWESQDGDITFRGENSGLKFNGELGILGSGEKLFLGKIGGTGSINVETQAIFDGAETDADLDLRVDAGTLVTRREVGSSDTVINSTLYLFDGTLESADTTFTGTIISDETSTWNAQGNTTLDGQLSIQSGVLSLTGVVNGSGSLSVADGADIDFIAGAQLNLESTIEGTVTDLQTNAETTLEGGTLDGAATIDNNLLVNTTETSFVDGSVEVSGVTQINEGTLEVAAAAVIFGTGDVVVDTNTALSVQGLVQKDVFVDEDGRINGIGLIEGDLLIDGILDPGNSAGRLEIDGDVTLTDVSMTDIEIGGTAAGTGHDQVLGNGGNAMLGGTLDVSLIEGFVPDQEDEFLIFDNFVYSGTFSNVLNGRVSIAGVGSFAISFGDGDGNSNFSKFAAENGITFSDFQAIPEPGCATLLAGVMLGMLTRRRRQTTNFV